MKGEERPELLGMDPPELESYLGALGLPSFRARQVFSWLHRGAAFAEMTDLPLSLRASLSEAAVDQPVKIAEKRVSGRDGTTKYLFGLGDGNCVEGVLMRYRHGLTLCVSTQAGCRMGCAFCASTMGGLHRNLTAAEMLGEVVCVNRELKGENVGNLVLMGSGEPLDNYDQTVRFLRLVSHPDGLRIGIRRVSLSTCGLVEGILRLAGEGLPVTLSVSLHAPNDGIRARIMPAARANPIDSVLSACRTYILRTGRRVIFEYALIRGVNSEPRHAAELAGRLRGMQCHVNLIPLNPVPGRPFRGAGEAETAAFLGELQQRNISVSRRRGMGDDIAGACGQLRRRALEGAACGEPAGPEAPGEKAQGGDHA